VQVSTIDILRVCKIQKRHNKTPVRECDQLETEWSEAKIRHGFNKLRQAASIVIDAWLQWTIYSKSNGHVTGNVNCLVIIIAKDDNNIAAVGLQFESKHFDFCTSH